jgi:hypothetical protein
LSLPIVPYNPKVTVRLHTVGEGWIDPTEEDLFKAYVDRSVNQPAGKWEVHLTSRQVPGKGGFIDRIQPMDYIEIAMSESGGAFYNPHPAMTTTMRGFVDNIQESVDSSGNWRVVVNGRDYGKLLLQFQVYYLTELDPAAALLGVGRLDYNFGLGPGALSPSTFVGEIDKQLIRPNMAMIKEEHPGIPDLLPSVTVPSRYAVNGFAIQPFTGPVWNLLTQYASRPWVEVFVQDQHAPILFYRFAPLFDYDGNFIDDGSGSNSRPHYADCSREDVISYSLGKSDNEVFTYYFTYPVFSYLERSAFKSAGTSVGRNPYLAEKARFKRFGFRPLEVSTTLIPTTQDTSAVSPGTVPFENIEMAASLNEYLVQVNKDNHRFLNGTITLRGAGNIQIGAHLRINGLNISCYVASVRHTYDVDEGTFKTTCGVTRVRPL